MSEEPSHYYLRDGTPCHEVPAKSKGPGGMRAFNLRWDRHLGASASVTTQLKIIAAPALEKWKRKQVVLSALSSPRVEGETHDELFDRIEKDGAAQAKTAADEGSRVHHASHYVASRQTIRRKVHSACQSVGGGK